MLRRSSGVTAFGMIAAMAAILAGPAWAEDAPTQGQSFQDLTLQAGDHDTGSGVATPDPIKPKIQRSRIAVEVDLVLTAPTTGRPDKPPAGLVQFEPARDGSRRMFLADQNGVIWLVKDGALVAEPFLDLRPIRGSVLVAQYLQSGLRSFAFHPDFAKPGAPGHNLFYTATTERAASADPGVTVLKPAGLQPEFDDVVAEWRIDPSNPNRIDTTSRREVLRIADPGSGHNIDLVAFNPLATPEDADYGKLYIGIGDGQNSRDRPDPYQQGQNTSSPLGGILRIDPLAQGGKSYAVPSDEGLRST